MFFEQYDHEPAIAVVRFWLAITGEPEAYRDRPPAKQAAGLPRPRRDGAHLAGRSWLVGDSMTLADIALYAYTHVAHEGGFDLGRYPAIGAWLDRVASEPGHVPIDA